MTSSPSVTINNPIGSWFFVVLMLCVSSLVVSGLVLTNQIPDLSMGSVAMGSVAMGDSPEDEVEVGDYVFATFDEAGEASQFWSVGKVTAITPDGKVVTTPPCGRYKKLTEIEIKTTYQNLLKFTDIKGYYLWDVFDGLRSGKIHPNDLDDLAEEVRAESEEKFPSKNDT